ncbi:MAG: DUF2167 domain-containing protein, partial [Bacteroidota bacterium]
LRSLKNGPLPFYVAYLDHLGQITGKTLQKKRRASSRSDLLQVSVRIHFINRYINLLTMNRTFAILLLLFCVATTANLYAQDETQDSVQIAIGDSLYITLPKMHYRTDTVTIGDDLATIVVPEGFKFLGREQSQYVLTDLWENPEDETTLGMLFPEDMEPYDMDMTYAIEISYSEEGYVDDKDAEDIDYEELLEDLQTDSKEDNKIRAELGYPTAELIGWATQPFYDQENKKLYWAKEIKFEGSEVNTLNYNIRILGRRGYLVLNAIGDIDVLPLVEQDASRVLDAVSFTEGNRYQDFDPDIDTYAAVGIGGLIAGKVLAKGGFFAVIAAFLAKAGKFILIALAGAGAFFRKMIFGKKE